MSLRYSVCSEFARVLGYVVTYIGNASGEQRRAIILVHFVSLFVHSVYTARNVNTARIQLHF
jgi:hypothetical protein